MFVLPFSTAYAQQDTKGADLVRAGAGLVSDGNYAAADKQLSSAISSDKLSTSEMSKALYYRGIANRRLGRQAQSVSDFNGALWLKGLTSSERANAHLYIGLAYRAAGAKARAESALKEAKKLSPDDERIVSAMAGEEVAERSSSLSSIRSIFNRRQAAVSPETEAAAAPAAQPAEKKAPEAQKAPPKEAEAEVPAFRTTITPAEPAPAQKAPERPKKVARNAPPETPSNWSTSTSVEPRAVAVPKESSDEPQSPEEKGRIGKFFTSLWNSDDEEAARAEGGSGQAESAASTWTKSTRVEEFNEPSSSGSSRSYRVQLASSRSEKEAQAYWQRLSTKYASLIGGREPVIEKTDLGTLGTFYRLQIGPFGDKREPLELCNEFKRGGLDCFLVAR